MHREDQDNSNGTIRFKIEQLLRKLYANVNMS